jgi:hypothetical protein
MPNSGSPSKIDAGATADIFALQEPTFKLSRAFDHLVCETVPCCRPDELPLYSGRTLLISQTACAKGEVEKGILRFSSFSESNNQATESQMNAGLTRSALLKALRQSGRLRKDWSCNRRLSRNRG